MSEHTPWCCDGYAAFCPLCPRQVDLVRCPGHAYNDRNRETVRISRLHANRAHPNFEYRTTEGARKQFDASTPPADDDGSPDPTWEVNVDAGRDGWERFDYTEEAYWRRRKRKAGGPCSRPECGGELHADPWGTPVQCPRAEPVVQADTGRRCPRCDCPDGHEQCQHCKVCPHARTDEAAEFAVSVGCAVLHRDAQGHVIPCPDRPRVGEASPHIETLGIETLGADGLTAAERQRKHIRAELQRQMPGLEADRLWEITLAVQRAANNQQEAP